MALGCREGVKRLSGQSVHLRWLPIHYFNRNAVANLLNIDLSRIVLGLLPVCWAAGPSCYIHCCRGLQEREGWFKTLGYTVRRCALAEYEWLLVLSCNTKCADIQATRRSSSRLEPVLCLVTNQWGIRGPQCWPVSWASVEPAGRWQTTSLPLGEEVAPLSFEVEGGTGRELRRTGSVTVVPPLSALLGLCALSPFGPTYQLVDAAGYVFCPSLCCVIEQDRPVRKACSGLLKGLWLTAWPDKLSQPSITDSHCLLEKEITETVTAACLSYHLFAMIKLPSLCQTSNVLIAISGER